MVAPLEWATPGRKMGKDLVIVAVTPVRPRGACGESIAEWLRRSWCAECQTQGGLPGAWV